MKIAFVSAMALGLVVAGGAVSAANASAVEVGAGTAHDCFVQADSNLDPRAGVALCTESLKNETLSMDDRAATLINRAILRARAMDMDGALADYAEAIDIGANLSEAYLNRSATLIALRRYGEAKNDADQAIRLGAHRLEIAYYNRAVADEALGDVGAAYEDYKAALRVEPRFAAASDQLMRFRVSPKGS
jgi:tetratricopeptide (TPR) repeat protein